MADKTADYYYTLTSPWTYLGHDLFQSLAARHGVTVDHKPVDLGSVFEVSGGLPLPKRAPQRQAYRMVELQRWRTYRNKPLNLQPRHFPADATPANRMVLAAKKAGLDAGTLSGAFLRAVWEEEKDIGDAATRQRIAASCGMDGAELLKAAEAPEILAEYQALTEEAKQRKVFGAPTYYYRGEPFWGQDRLPFVERAFAGETQPIPIA